MSVHLAQFREAMREALGTYLGKATEFQLQLPGFEWEPFGLSTGSPVFWKQEPISHGRMVRFRSEGPAAIGLHYHDVPEVITAAVGVLHYTVDGRARTLIPGDTFTAQPHVIHSAEFPGPGEALAHWTDLDSDTLHIAYFS